MGIELFIAGVMVVAFVLSAVLAGRRMKTGWSPRKQQGRQRFWFYYALGLLALFGAVQAYSGSWDWRFFAFWGVFVLLIGYQAFRALSEREQLKNFALEPKRCGRCEYDLTGNVTGVCPECGWTIPPSPPEVEKPTWGMWWTGWDIEYLEDWRKTLWSMIAILVMFAGLTAWFVIALRATFVTVLPALMCVHFGINIARVVAYGRRTGRGS